jgi:hypothetical protein
MNDSISISRKDYDDLTHEVRHLETLSKYIIRLLIGRSITVDDLVSRVGVVHELTNRISNVHDLMNGLKRGNHENHTYTGIN